MLGFYPTSAAALSSLPDLHTISATVEGTAAIDDTNIGAQYAATVPFITLPTDFPSNQPFLGTLQKPISFQRSIVGANGYGELSVGVGEMELINSEADYDAFSYRFSIDGRRVIVKAGERELRGEVSSYADFTTIADLTGSGWHFNEDIVRISVRDNAFKFEVPTQPNTYDGKGGVNGTVDLAGKRKPMVLGWAKNITPVFLIPAELIYQCHDGPVEAITAVYDSGNLLTFQTDFATVLDQRNAPSPSAGTYSTCRAEGGLIRLGAAPAGQITADVKGALNASGVWINTTADIVRYIIFNACLVEETDFDEVTFDTLNTLQPAQIGYFLDPNKNETVAETVGKFMDAVGGWCGFTMLGKIEVRRFDLPGIAASIRYNQYDFMGPVVRERLPAGVDPIVQRVRIAYDWNWTVQSGTEIAGAVHSSNPDRVSYLAEEFRIAATSDAAAESIVSDHPLAHDPDPIPAYFVDKIAADEEALRRLRIYGMERSAFRFVVKDHSLAQDVGDTIFISHIRFGLNSGRFLTVVQVNDNLETNETEILGFG
jgi:hypothetical protein